MTEKIAKQVKPVLMLDEIYELDLRAEDRPLAGSNISTATIGNTPTAAQTIIC